MSKVNGWLIALIIVVIIIIILIILAAVYTSPGPSRTINVKTQVSDRQLEISGHCSNLSLTLVNLSNLTSNFLHQSKCGFKNLDLTFAEMNNHVESIGNDLVVVTGCKDLKINEILCDKHEIYKALVEETIINKNAIDDSHHLLKHLNDRNVALAKALHEAKNSIDIKNCIQLLHQYDLYVVGQLGALVVNDYTKFLRLSNEASKVYVRFVYMIKVSCHKL